MEYNFEKIGDLIRERREARGMSQADLAQTEGTTQQNVARIEKGQGRHSRYLQHILAALGMDVNKAIGLTAEAGDLIPRELLVAEKGMPLYAAAEGGDGAVIINFDAVDYLKWPAPLLHVADGFGVLVVEESMFPAFEPGDIALVNPRLQPRRGKNAVLLGPDNGQRVKALIKRFDGQSESVWRVQQWNPQESFTLSKAEWPRCYSVVGKYDAR